jgi:hypothetical protein
MQRGRLGLSSQGKRSKSSTVDHGLGRLLFFVVCFFVWFVCLFFFGRFFLNALMLQSSQVMGFLQFICMESKFDVSFIR